MSVQVNIPESVFNLPRPQLGRQVLETVALEGFQSGQLSLFQIREMLGFESRFEVHEFLAKNGIPWVDYPVEDLERERNDLKELLDQ